MLRESDDWRRKLDKNLERVVLCRNVDGEEFAVSLKTRKEGQFVVGKFTEAPALKMKIMMNKHGIIEECSGDSKALIGFKHSSLKGMRLDDLLEVCLVFFFSFLVFFSPFVACFLTGPALYPAGRRHCADCAGQEDCHQHQASRRAHGVCFAARDDAPPQGWHHYVRGQPQAP